MGVLSSSSKIVTSFFTADYNLNQAVAKLFQLPNSAAGKFSLAVCIVSK